MSEEIEIVPPASHPTKLEPLTLEETDRRAELWAIIQPQLKNFNNTGKALAEIRDRRLYRNTHSTFADFCEFECGMSRRKADRMIAMETITNVIETTCLKIPVENKKQAKDLSALTKTQLEKVSKKIEKAKITGQPVSVSAAIKSVQPKSDPELVRPRNALHAQLLEAQKRTRQQQEAMANASSPAEIIELTYLKNIDDWLTSPATIRAITDIYKQAFQ